MIPAEAFARWLGGLDTPTVVEIGTRRSNPSVATHHSSWIPAGGLHVKVDAFSGLDVDVEGDGESLPFRTDSVDAVINVSTLEHIPRPWRAVESIARVLRPGGRAYIASHQTFPLHGYPHDYFRFSLEAYAVMAQDAGLVVVEQAYEFPARIVPPKVVRSWNNAASAWLNSSVVVEKS